MSKLFQDYMQIYIKLCIFRNSIGATVLHYYWYFLAVGSCSAGPASKLNNVSCLLKSLLLLYLFSQYLTGFTKRVLYTQL